MPHNRGMINVSVFSVQFIHLSGMYLTTFFISLMLSWILLIIHDVIMESTQCEFDLLVQAQ